MNKLLIIDDSPLIHALIRVYLSSLPIQIFGAENGESGLEMAWETEPDVLLLDVDMPWPDGFEVCRRLKESPETMSIAILFLTSASSTEEKIRGLELGAVDYITKPFDPAELRARVGTAMRTRYLVELLEKRAAIDGLTGLWNRRYFEQRIAAEAANLERCGRPFSCIMADVDNFKVINDRHGHPFADVILRSICETLLAESRAEDVVCRYGGEELAIITPGVDACGATAMAERARVAIEGLRFPARSDAVRVTCSFGVAQARPGNEPSLVRLADAAMYQAKRRGRNCVMCDQVGNGEQGLGTREEVMGVG